MKQKQTKDTERKGFNLLYEYLRYHNDTANYINKFSFGSFRGLFKPTATSEFSEQLSYVKMEVLIELMKDPVVKKTVWKKFYEALRTEVFPEIYKHLVAEHPEYTLEKDGD